MLEPTNKIIHPILQPHEEVKLSCHVPETKPKIFNLLFKGGDGEKAFKP
jgi:hypothetical protein